MWLQSGLSGEITNYVQKANTIESKTMLTDAASNKGIRVQATYTEHWHALEAEHAALGFVCNCIKRASVRRLKFS